MMNVKKIGAAKIATAAVLSAAALAVYVVESLFPPLILPGAKMGLSNVFVLLALVCLGVGYAFAALAVKIAVGNLIVGNFSTLMYSLPAGVISLAVMSLLFFNGKSRFGLIALSVAGAVVHNAVQNAVYALVTDTPAGLSLLPYLALIGVLSGAIVGAATYFALKIVPKSQWQRLLDGVG